MTANTQGALLMMASMAAFTFNDALVKLAGDDMPLFQIVTLRGMLACLWIYLLARHLGALHFRFGRRDRVLVLLRCLTEIGATYFFRTALLRMPLANVTAVLQVLPLSVTLGAALIFAEPVGWRRMLSIGIGFLGMLLIVRPGPDGFGGGAGFALASVLCVTARDLLTRRMSAGVPSMTVTLCTALAVTTAAALASTTVTWVPLTPERAMQVGGASVFILLGYLCSVMVMRVGEVGFVAPFRYTGLVWALLLGWAAFGDWPDPLTLLGAVTVVASGLFMLYRERRISETRTRA